MPVESIKGVVDAAIQRASSATGVDFSFLMGTARRESSLNPSAKAPSSSAAGLFQFVEQTWLGTLKSHGAKYGYARYADLIQKGSDGKYRVPAGAESRQMIMDLRFDPRAASLMAGELTSDHAAYLRGSVGRNPTSGELYAAHFLGPEGSARLIRAVEATPQAPAATLFPDAAKANHNIFYRAGRPATVAEVYANLTTTPSGEALPLSSTPSPVQQAAFITYASGRQNDRLQQQRDLINIVLRGSEDNQGTVAGSLFDAALMRAVAYGQSRRE
ncbi:MAG: transglycosylase SLT domain-containing protein, partial [Alphaproteobacteria bacterium]